MNGSSRDVVFGDIDGVSVFEKVFKEKVSIRVVYKEIVNTFLEGLLVELRQKGNKATIRVIMVYKSLKRGGVLVGECAGGKRELVLC